MNNISGLFFECTALEYFPDISIWNISNVNDISFLFYEYKSLK